jgi:YD repeat-containing protein
MRFGRGGGLTWRNRIDEEMQMSTHTDYRELDHRDNDGIDVRLLWHPASDRVSIAIVDERSGESMAFEIDPADALAAFHHPFAYAASQQPHVCAAA